MSTQAERSPRPETPDSSGGFLPALESPKFSRAIRTVFSRERRQDALIAEQGFDLLRSETQGLSLVYSDFLEFGAIRKGDKGNARFRRLVEAGYFPFISFHTHPPHPVSLNYGRYSLFPSAEDLHALSMMREYLRDQHHDGFPLMTIGISVGNGTMRMLAIQESRLTPVALRRHQQVSRELDYARTQTDLLDTLKDYGYRAAVVSFRTGIHTPRFTPADRQALTEFRFELSAVPTDRDIVDPGPLLG